MKPQILNARLPELSEVRGPRFSDPISEKVLTRHLINIHLQAENMERYGLPMYDLQLAFTQNITLPRFCHELLERIALPEAKISADLRLREVPWTVERYKNFLIQTLAYGEYLGVLEPSNEADASLLDSLYRFCPPIVLPHSSRDEMFDQNFLEG